VKGINPFVLVLRLLYRLEDCLRNHWQVPQPDTRSLKNGIRRSRSSRRKTGLSNPSDCVFAFNWQVIAKTLAELTKEVVINMKEEGYRG
jgi:hypothetical protein